MTTASVRSLLAVGVTFWCLAGCAGLKSWRGNQASLGVCHLPPNPTAADIVEVVNGNTDRIHGYTSHTAKVRANGLSMNANVSVESESRCRIVVHSMAGTEVDIGSNDDLFWFWVKRNDPPHVFFARHEDIDIARDQLQIPFEPAWLMEALGVKPLEGDDFQVQHNDKKKQATLVSWHQQGDGSRLRKQVVVDTLHGQVLEHSLWKESGQLVARATHEGYFRDRKTGVILSKRIDIEWPQVELAFTLDLGNVEVNPSRFPESTWLLPEMKGYQVVDLGAEPSRNRPASHRSSPRQPSRQARTDQTEASLRRPPAEKSVADGQSSFTEPAWAR